MKDSIPQPQDTPQPAAYDPEGRPLYYHPATTAEATEADRAPSLVTTKPDGYEGSNFNPKIRAQYANEPDFVHVTRPLEPTVPEVGDALKRKHEESVRLFPQLNLSDGEFVILQIRRHPIGLLIPIFITMLSITVLTSMLLLVPDFYASAAPSQMTFDLPPADGVVGVLLLLIILVGLLGGASIWVYLKNQFFLTNESVIQEVQTSLFSQNEQTVSLGSIEDASFKRQGILQHLFDYGTMRLSTEGTETTYRFAFVANPKHQIAIVNNAVEAFKNGRPVGTEYLD